MTRILILGGYGTFGGRIARRAAAAGFAMLVAGRSREKAEAYCAGDPRLVPVEVADAAGLARALAEHRPFALVDAAGPFQGAGYERAQAAIAAGCHYLDIADGRAFVTGIAALDAEARAAGVAVISGASSVPALSGAAARRLAEGLDEVRAVEIVLSASSRGTGGRSVIAAILSYIGRPVRLRSGGRWTSLSGWSGPRRHRFELAGPAPLAGRLVALAEVPDLDLLPERLPGRPAVRFLAGTDIGLHARGLSLLAWAVRRGWLRRPGALAGLLAALQRATGRAGSPRSAMEVRLWGVAGERRVERRWTLIAEEGEGPEIPALAVPLLLERLRAGDVPPGARDAGGLLTLEDFGPALASIACRHGVGERELPPCVYAGLMGERFAGLPPAVRRMHEVLRDGGASGEGEVRRGRSVLARLVGAVMGFPPEGVHKLHVAFDEREGKERWTRHFGAHAFSSELSARGGLLVERFGPLRFGFELPSEAGGLSMTLRRWWVGPLPMPLALAPRTDAREWEEEGRFRFDVAIALPLAGPVVHYRGWLEESGT